MTPKQQRFVEEYLVDLNATQAAIRAGYSEKTAYSQGQRLLKNAEIQKSIADAQAARSEKVAIDAEWVLRRLAMEAEADLGDLYDAEGTLKPIAQWPLIWRQGLVAGIDVEEIRVEGVTIGNVRKLKLSDRVKRLELIGKHVDVNAFKENLDHRSSDGSMSPPSLSDFYGGMVHPDDGRDS